jgi:hypothetical protein
VALTGAAVPTFLAELARRLVPRCDGGVVGQVYALASAGGGGRRLRDGRPASGLTPWGVPFEASVTGGPGRSPGALRYVTEPASGLPFFGPRLAGQREALDELAAWLPLPARAAAGELRGMVDALFPDPGAVPARTRFATYLGIVHGPEVPEHLSGLKVYGSLTVGEAGAALDRLARRWEAFDALRDLTADVPALAPRFAAVAVDARGRLGHRLYLRTRGDALDAVEQVARRCGTGVTGAADVLRSAGVDDAVWRRPLVVCCARGQGAGDGTSTVELSVHMGGRALGRETGAALVLAADIAARHGDAAGVEALAGAIGAAGGPAAWGVTMVGIGLAPGAGAGKLNVYAAPRQALTPTFSNSGWMGSRVGA